MKKIVKGIVCAGLACTLLASVGCKNKKLDPEERHLSLSTAALDGNFNPFFYTSQNDGSMLSHTQISLLTSNENGELVCGENEATVALDWSKTKYADEEGTQALPADATLEETDHTTYEFLIKKGIKFSDGKDLTIKDVLFNIYVYLDPAYTGSSTMYSTDIKGLNAYRTQDPLAQDGDLADVDAMFRGPAQSRIKSLVDWSSGETNSYDENDLATVRKLFKEEISSDWTALETSWQESYKLSYRFTAAWQAYLFNEGIITVQTKINANGSTSQLFEDTNGNGVKDDGELYYTTLDPNQTGSAVNEVEAQHIIDEINNYVSENLSKYMSDNGVDEETATLALQRDASINIVYRNYAETRGEIQNILLYWATGSSVLEDFIGQLRSKYYEDIKNDPANAGKLAVQTIEGITAQKASSFKGKALDSEYDVLRIVINGIDPKAEFSFAIPVAPLHYYSGSYNGKDYVALANTTDSFGVEMGNKDFFDNVIKGSGKNGLPVGAGAYKAATYNEQDTSDKTEFFKNNIVHFKRNEFFETVGAGISNAKIKYIDYKVLSDDRIMDALVTQSIDFGTPNATSTNSGEVSTNSKFLEAKSYPTGGYGYIGVNPKFVPEINVRRALMRAMDVNLTMAFYGSGYSEIITRPVSKTSWSYTLGYGSNPPAEHENVAYTSDDDEIIALVTGAGYEKGSDGIFVKRRNVSGQANAQIGKKLKLTFTLAGETNEHPAYRMFTATAARLNQLGFDITVNNDIQALRKLNSGNLAVWAAAWSSAIDPDMYQVYHMDSGATSVNNWNYKNILNDTATWSTEYNIISDLSEKIEEAREMDDKATRAGIYTQCYDLVMELAVELPTYQRHDLCVYNKTIIDGATLVQNPSYQMGLFDKIWEINYVK